jgi:hypothetical protein
MALKCPVGGSQHIIREVIYFWEKKDLAGDNLFTLKDMERPAEDMHSMMQTIDT